MSSNKSKSRSTGQPRSAGNEPVEHFKVSFTPSERSAKPSVVEAKNKITRGQTSRLPKKPSVNTKIPLTSTRNTGTKINFSGDGSKTVDLDRTAIFSSVNPSLAGLHEKATIETAKKKGKGKVGALIEKFEQRSKMGGKKTRKNKKSKKSKTRSKRC